MADFEEFPIPTRPISDLDPRKIPTPGVVTQDVSKLALSGAGTQLSPWRGWDEDLVDLVDHNRAFVIPSGVYEYDNTLTMPAIGKRNVEFRGELGAILQYTGSDECVVFPQTAESYWNVTFTKITIEGGGNATDGLALHWLHHSTFEDVCVRNVTGTKFLHDFNVFNTFRNLHATTRVGDVNGTDEESTLCTNGFILSGAGGVATTQSNNFINCIAEFCQEDGWIFDSTAQWNTILVGTGENCGGRGMSIFGQGNTIVGTDLEATGNAGREDIYIAASWVTLKNCIVRSRCRIGRSGSVDIVGVTIDGGNFGDILIDFNARYTNLKNVPGVNFFPLGGGGGTLIDNSDTTMIHGTAVDLDVSPIMPVNDNQLVTPGHGLFKGDTVHADDFGPVLRDRTDRTLHRLVVTGGSLSLEAVTTDYGFVQSDDFSTAQKQWHVDSFAKEYPSALVTVALVGSQLSITLPNSDATVGGSYAGYGNKCHDLLDGGSERIKFIQKPAAGSYQMRFAIGQHHTTHLLIFSDGTNLTYGEVSGGSFGSVASVAFNPATMVYWRFRRSTTTIVAEYSADASSWTTLGTTTPGFSLDRIRTVIEAGSTASSTFSQAVKFDLYVYDR